MASSVDPDQTAIGAVCSGSTLFASILNSLVMLGNYLQQTTSAYDIFRCIFFSAFKGTIFRKLGVRVIIDVSINVDVRVVDGKFMIQSLSLLDLTTTNVILSRFANRLDFECGTYIYPSIKDITRKYIGSVQSHQVKTCTSAKA